MISDLIRERQNRNTGIEAIRLALIEGEKSGISDQTPEDIRKEVQERLGKDSSLPTQLKRMTSPTTPLPERSPWDLVIEEGPLSARAFPSTTIGEHPLLSIIIADLESKYKRIEAKSCRLK